jgi:hypothetical protein
MTPFKLKPENIDNIRFSIYLVRKKLIAIDPRSLDEAMSVEVNGGSK